MLAPNVPNITLNNGLSMPQLGFGVYKISDEATTAAVSSALKAGYRSIDTAAIYGNEPGVGRAIAEAPVPREELFVTSKLWVDAFSYDQAMRGYEESLSRLGLDALDLYLLHWPAPATDGFLDAWRALTELATDGRVRAVGVCNFLPEHLERLAEVSDLVPAVNQVELHPALQNRAVEAANSARGIVTEAWSPLARGAVLDEPALHSIAERHGVSTAQVILRWHLQKGHVVIPKSVTPERIIANLHIFDFALSSGELAAIDQLERDGRTGPHPAEFQG